ncbi:MAG: ribbon-helix-helix protein, CopG family [Planctomycetes bacterium]|nr:ribbon-helix-helix protein, CopG family [Planctomycetota bacterium]
MTVPISLRLPEDVAEELDALARNTERPRSYLIVKALEAYLDEYADYRMALDRLHDHRDAVISSRELLKRLGKQAR